MRKYIQHKLPLKLSPDTEYNYRRTRSPLVESYGICRSGAAASPSSSRLCSISVCFLFITHVMNTSGSTNKSRDIIINTCVSGSPVLNPAFGLGDLLLHLCFQRNPCISNFVIINAFCKASAAVDVIFSNAISPSGGVKSSSGAAVGQYAPLQQC